MESNLISAVERTAHFNPNELTFEDGILRIEHAIQSIGAKLEGKILTSKDAKAKELCSILDVKNVPDGFTKWQLPFYLDGGQFFISVGEPNVAVPLHSHDEGPGVRFIISGSIHYKDIILSQGDWMFIPAGKEYEFTVGPEGAMMAYCYQCCCA